MTDLEELARLEKAATPGPWAVGDYYMEAGTHPPANPELEQCVLCGQNGPPTKVWIDERGIEMHRHRRNYWIPDLSIFETRDGETRVAGMLGYDSGGIAKPEDAALIVAMRNALPALLELLRAAENEVRELSQRLQRIDDASYGERLGL